MHRVRLVVRQSVPGLALWAALAAPLPAQADFYQRDDGVEGIVLSNLPGSGGTLVLAEPRQATASAVPRSAPDARHLARREAIAPLVATAAAAHDLPEALLLAVIETESNFDAQALSPKGAQGLMQLMPQTARHLGVADAFDPAANIDGGARYLKSLLTRFGNDLSLALAAYNAGPGAVQRHGAIPPYVETQSYVPRILRRYHSLAGRP